MFLNLKIKIILYFYEKIGLKYGEYLSYDYMFPCDNYYEEYLKRKYNRWEKRYLSLGFKQIPLNVWVDSGGYGVNHKKYMMIKN